MKRPLYPVDLHTHSKRSDGNDTVLELIDFAILDRLKAIALTDHDIRFPQVIALKDGCNVEPVAYAKSKGLILIPGIEYSCDTNVDDVHIVGLGCNFDHPEILQAEKNAEISKMNGYRKLTEILCENGINVTWQDVLNGTNPPRNPEEVQRKHIFEAIAEKGYTSDWSDAKLMVRDNPKFNVKREKINPVTAIKTIHNSGGIAILAHPWLIDPEVQLNGQNVTRFDYIEHLIIAGLDGIEAAYPYEKTSYKGTENRNEVENIVLDKYSLQLAVISGGSDYHDDGRKGVSNPRYLGEGGISWEYFCTNPLLKRFLQS